MVTKKGLTFCLVVTCLFFVATLVLISIINKPDALSFKVLCFLLPATVFSTLMLATSALVFASKEVGRIHNEDAKNGLMDLQTFSGLPKELQTKETLKKILEKT